MAPMHVHDLVSRMTVSPRNSPWVILSAALALWMVALPGCMSIHASPQALDWPLPQRISLPPPCAAKDPSKLAENGSCFAIVQSESKFSNIGLTVTRGEYYRISVPGIQLWFDKDRHVPAPQGDEGSPLIRHASAFKRHPVANWFALMATTSKSSGQAQDIGRNPVFEVTEDGPLLLYPNDASFTYGNNHGRIMVVVQRCAGQTACGIQP